MSELETFGFADDAEESPSVVAPPAEDPAELKAIIAEATKAAAECMDAGEAEAHRAVRRAAEERLKALAADSGIKEVQWTDLAMAYKEMKLDFKARLAELGGISNDAYHTLTQELSEAHRKPKGKGGRKPKPKDKKDEPPKEEFENTPEERWDHIVQHITNLGMDAVAIATDLGIANQPLSHEVVSAVLREANKRAQPEEVETFGVEKSGGADQAQPAAVPIPSAAAASLAPATPVLTTGSNISEPAAPASRPNTSPPSVIWDEQLKKAIETDTGEVVTVAYFLELLGIAELPAQPDREIAEKILDVMHTRYLDPAKRYREQAEKRAAPLEKSAAQMEAFFGPYLDSCGDKFLPRYGARAKAENQGKFSSKTLDLATGSISWTKAGGVTNMDSGRYYMWCQKKLEEMQALMARCREGDDEAKEELKYLQDTYGLKIETKAVANADKIKSLGAQFLPDGWELLESNEFAKRTIK